MTAPAAAPDTPKKTTSPREYVVLEITAEGTWAINDRVKATSSDAAIRAVLLAPNNSTVVEIVAVPARNWKPRKPKVETKTTIKLG